MKAQKVVIVLAGRYAGRKAVVIKVNFKSKKKILWIVFVYFPFLALRWRKQWTWLRSRRHCWYRSLPTKSNKTNGKEKTSTTKQNQTLRQSHQLQSFDANTVKFDLDEKRREFEKLLCFQDTPSTLTSKKAWSTKKFSVMLAFDERLCATSKRNSKNGKIDDFFQFQKNFRKHSKWFVRFFFYSDTKPANTNGSSKNYDSKQQKNDSITMRQTKTSDDH